jgi:FkbM family methyltransferase
MLERKINRLRQLNEIKKLIAHNAKPSLNNIADKLDKYLNFEDGFFVELGANNGYNQSNTFHLEYLKNWKGILIEGIPELYNMCKYIRINSIVENYACVSDGFKQKEIMMRYAGLMSIVTGALKSEEKDDLHIKKGLKCQNINKEYIVKVRTSTLTNILKKHNVCKIDFLSLDVEGFELQVLKGFDVKKFKPTFICIEANFFDEIDEFLSPTHRIIDQLSHHDYLYKIR